MAFGIRFCLVTLTGIIVMEVPNFNSLMSLIGNLLKSIDNCSGAALKTDRILWTTSCTHKFSLFQLIKLFLTILVIYGFHSENFFGEKIWNSEPFFFLRKKYVAESAILDIQSGYGQQILNVWMSGLCSFSFPDSGHIGPDLHSSIWLQIWLSGPVC